MWREISFGEAVILLMLSSVIIGWGILFVVAAIKTLIK
jgi:hypothetical protein